MMPSSPFFRFPMFYNSFRNPYYYSQHNMNNNVYPNSFNNSYANCNRTSYNSNIKQDVLPPSNASYSSKVDEKSSSDNYTSNEQFFDIFGIRLYFDDILILCLLFFLYEEGVNDNLLFISLLLLLLS